MSPFLHFLAAQMPNCDGCEATERIRRLEASGAVPGSAYIVALTANASPEDQEECRKAGMTDYLSK